MKIILGIAGCKIETGTLVKIDENGLIVPVKFKKRKTPKDPWINIAKRGQDAIIVKRSYYLKHRQIIKLDRCAV